MSEARPREGMLREALRLARQQEDRACEAVAMAAEELKAASALRTALEQTLAEVEGPQEPVGPSGAGKAPVNAVSLAEGLLSGAGEAPDAQARVRGLEDGSISFTGYFQGSHSGREGTGKSIVATVSKLSEDAKRALLAAPGSSVGRVVPAYVASGAALAELSEAGLIGQNGGLTVWGSVVREHLEDIQLDELFGRA